MNVYLKTTQYLLGLNILLATQIAHSQVINNSNLTINPVFTPAPPVLDGELNDYCWTESTILGIDNSQNVLDNSGNFKHIIGNSITIQADGVSPLPNNPNGQSATFSTAWDENYLYWAVKVIAPNATSLRPNSPTLPYSESIELFINNGNGTTTINPGDPYFPQIYNPYRDAQVPLNYKNSPSVSSIEAKGLGHGLLLKSSSAVIKNTTDGYIMEGRILWKEINKEFIDDLSGEYTDISKKPSNTRIPFRFDIANNITSINGTERAAQKMWNQCCWNCNWTISRHFGTMKLNGISSQISLIGISIHSNSSLISVAGQTMAMSMLISPRGANSLVSWSVLGTISSGFPIASISEFGVLSPLNNGIITVVASSLANSNISTIKVITITNQLMPSSLEISANDISTNWGFSSPSVVANPSGASSGVKYSLDATSQIYATINTLTGAIRSKAMVESFVVTVTATSIANGLTSSKTINITQQSPVNCFSLNNYQYINQCSKYPNTVNGKGFYTMRAGSYSISDKMSLYFEYADIYNTTSPGIIPVELTTLKVLGTPLGSTVLSSTPDAHILSLLSSAIVVTLSGSYIYNPSLSYTVVLLASTNSNTITSTCNGNTFNIRNPYPLGCGSTIVHSQPQSIINFPVLANSYSVSTSPISFSNLEATSGLTPLVTSSNTNVVSVSGTNLVFRGTGNTTITVSQNGNSTYSAAPSLVYFVNVTSSSQTITGFPILNSGYLTTQTPISFASASASSGLPLQVTSSNTSLVSINGTNLVFRGNIGTVTITASQAGNGTFSAAQSISYTINIANCTVPSMPSLIFNLADRGIMCQNSITYQMVNPDLVNNEYYAWTYMGNVVENLNDWSGDGSFFKILTLSGSGLFEISVTKNNACGSSLPLKYNYTTNGFNAPDASIFTITGSDVLQTNSSEIYTINTISGITTNDWFYQNSFTNSTDLDLQLVTLTANKLNIISQSKTGNFIIYVTPQNNLCNNVNNNISKSITLGSVFSQPSLNTPIIFATGSTSLQTSFQNTASYQWKFNNTDIGSNNYFLNNVTNTGTYTVTVYNSVSNIVSTGYYFVYNSTNCSVPSQPSNFNDHDNVVSLGLKSYYVSSVAGVTYNWAVSGNGNYINSIRGNEVDVNWAVPGTLSVTPSNNCGTGLARSLSIISINANACTPPAQPSIFDKNATTVCPGNATYTVNYTAGVAYLWSISGVGNSILVGNGNQATVNWSNTGTLSVIAVEGSCKSAARSLTIISTTPPTAPTISVIGNLSFCKNSSVTLSSSATTGNIWSNGELTQNIVVTSSGTFTVSAGENCGITSAPVSTTVLSPPVQNICMVGVDETTGQNIVVFNKPSDVSRISQWDILRETSSTDIYDVIKTINLNEMSTYIDGASYPKIKSYRYRVDVKDNCNNVSEGNIHQTMHLTINKGLNNAWNLIWTPYQGKNVVSYRINRGTSSSNLAYLDGVSGSMTSYTDITAPSSGTLYYMIEIATSGCSPSARTEAFNAIRSNVENTQTLNLESISNLKNVFTISPNPNSGQFEIRSSIETNFIILSLDGKIIYESDLKTGKNSFNIAIIPGFYILKTKEGKVQKLIIE
ncbi:MAG: T9SS C-terminal target domain-containing protein [Cytophagales bacterium]|nr:MAG: T9SS C-terminal target domain-containing protein [Cytophagales bacterium]